MVKRPWLLPSSENRAVRAKYTRRKRYTSMMRSDCMYRLVCMAACPSLDVTMLKLLSRVAREVWTLLGFIAFLTEATVWWLRLVWFALRHPLWTSVLALLGYGLFITVRSALLPPG